MLGTELAMRFRSFDDLTANVETALPSIIGSFEGVLERCGTSAVDALLIGRSHEREAPENYMIRTGAEFYGVTDENEEMPARCDAFAPEAYKLVELPDMVCAPALTPETCRATGLKTFKSSDDPAVIIHGLRHAIEGQRQA
jgi:hypothetical protein